MIRVLAAILFGLILAGTGAAGAEVTCAPHCDYWHDYGPYDLTYLRPGLYGYPVCGPRGNCAPYLAYTNGRGYYDVYYVRKTITIRVPRKGVSR